MASTDFTIADVLAWARTKPADAPYSSCDPLNCAFAQFGRETGRAELINVGNLIGAIGMPLAACAFHNDTFGGFARSLSKLERKERPSVWTRIGAYFAREQVDA